MHEGVFRGKKTRYQDLGSWSYQAVVGHLRIRISSNPLQEEKGSALDHRAISLALPFTFCQLLQCLSTGTILIPLEEN